MDYFWCEDGDFSSVKSWIIFVCNNGFSGVELWIVSGVT